MAAIYKKEIKSYFTSITGCVYTAFMLLFGGLYFTIFNLRGAYTDFEYTLASMVYILLVITPLLSMRVFSEERKQKTDQLLLTSPVSITKIVFGKYFAMLTVYALPLVIYCLFPLILKIYANVNLAPAYATILGFFLLGAACLAVGVFVSALSDNQVLSAVITFAVILIGYLMQAITQLCTSSAFIAVLVLLCMCILVGVLVYGLTKHTAIAVIAGTVCVGVILCLYFFNISVITTMLSSIMGAFALFIPFYQFAYGMLDFSSVVYYLSVCGVMIFLTIQAIEKRRWS